LPDGQSRAVIEAVDTVNLKAMRRIVDGLPGNAELPAHVTWTFTCAEQKDDIRPTAYRRSFRMCHEALKFDVLGGTERKTELGHGEFLRG
jgi:hypothetical protein